MTQEQQLGVGDKVKVMSQDIICFSDAGNTDSLTYRIVLALDNWPPYNCTCIVHWRRQRDFALTSLVLAAVLAEDLVHEDLVHVQDQVQL